MSKTIRRLSDYTLLGACAAVMVSGYLAAASATDATDVSTTSLWRTQLVEAGGYATCRSINVTASPAYSVIMLKRPPEHRSVLVLEGEDQHLAGIERGAEVDLVVGDSTFPMTVTTAYQEGVRSTVGMAVTSDRQEDALKFEAALQGGDAVVEMPDGATLTFGTEGLRNAEWEGCMSRARQQNPDPGVVRRQT